MPRRRRRNRPGKRSPANATLGRTSADRAASAAPIVVNGWTLLFWTDFRARWDAMRDAVREARNADPVGYPHVTVVKFFKTVRDLVFDEIPANPDHPQFRQGKTLGSSHSHWRRAKFHGRFRLFFRFHSASRTIIYAWLNDENTLRKAGSSTDPYAVFRRLLERGTPPSDWNSLVAASQAPDPDES